MTLFYHGITERRKHRTGIRIVTVLLCMAAVLATGCGRQQRSSGKMLVAASIAPMANFAKHVGGDLVEVELLVPPGSDPHTYQIEPAQMETLSSASVLVLNGAGLEFWADSAIDAANNSRLIVVRTADGLRILDHAEADGGRGNPHVWVDPIDAIHQIGRIRDAFIKADPKHAADYKANADQYTTQLKKLDSEIRSQVRQFKSKSFVSFHPTWVYFARRYGLIEAATIEESPGKEPTPEIINHAIKVAKRLNAKAVFTEPQASPKAAQVVAEEVGAKVLLLDAFGKPPDYDYIATMRSNVQTMAEALQ